MNTLLKLLLLCSLSINGYFIWQLSRQESTVIADKQQFTATQVNSAVQPKLFEHAITLFNNQQFDKAVAAYSQLKDNSPQYAQQLKHAWQQTVETWLLEQHEHISEQFLSAFLNSHPYDAAMLKLDAKRLINQGYVQQGIVNLMALSDQLDSNPHSDLTQQIEELTTLHSNHLINTQHWQQLLEHSQQWLEYAPYHAYYLYIHALAYYHLGDYVASQISLEQLPDNHAFKTQSDQLKQKIQHALAGVEKVKLTPRGAHYLVSSVINHEIEATLMIDTGASFTVIDQALLNTLSEPARYIDTLHVNTANGLVEAQRYRVQSFRIGQQKVDDFDILVINNHTGFGLLGMNFLEKFKFNINQQLDELELTKTIY
jgi:clan AA aspartic protease (TIGR02281 family)